MSYAIIGPVSLVFRTALRTTVILYVREMDRCIIVSSACIHVEYVCWELRILLCAYFGASRTEDIWDERNNRQFTWIKHRQLGTHARRKICEYVQELILLNFPVEKGKKKRSYKDIKPCRTMVGIGYSFHNYLVTSINYTNLYVCK